MRSLTTTPILSCRFSIGFIPHSSRATRSTLACLFLRAYQGLHAGYGSSHVADPAGLLQLPCHVLEAQVELLLDKLLLLFPQLLQCQVLQLAHPHALPPDQVLKMNLVRMGSFVAARRSASLAVSWPTPSSSKSTLPGLTTATHPSGAPFPLPMRVS